MFPFEFLSDDLDICIDSHDFSLKTMLKDNQDERQMLASAWKRFKLAISSLEGFSDKLAAELVASFQDDPELWDWIIDDHYSREVVANIRGMVNRFLKLSQVPAGIIPSSEVTIYLREATRCYAYGFSQASIALARAALEAGLNEYLRRKVKAGVALKLMEKIKAAERFKLIDRSCAALAEDVSKAAGMVLHQKPASDSLAFDTLSRTRGVLLALYEN